MCDVVLIRVVSSTHQSVGLSSAKLSEDLHFCQDLLLGPFEASSRAVQSSRPQSSLFLTDEYAISTTIARLKEPDQCLRYLVESFKAASLYLNLCILQSLVNIIYSSYGSFLTMYV